MQPTGPQIERLQQALLSAYPSESALRRMVRIRLDASLDAIVPLHRQNQAEILFDLIERYAFQPGGLHRLIKAAVIDNPGNPHISELAAEFLSIEFDPLSTQVARSLSSLASHGQHSNDIFIDIRLRMEHAFTAIWDFIHDDEQPLVEIELQNLASHHRRLRISAEIQQFSTQAIKSLQLAPGESSIIRLLPTLLREKLRSMNAPTRAIVIVTVADLESSSQLHQEGYLVWLLPRNTAPIGMHDPSTGVWVDLTRYLGAYVTPDAPIVRSFLRNAALHHPKRRLAARGDGNMGVAKAIYDALKEDIDIVYVAAPSSFSLGSTFVGHRVRFPSESLVERQANEVDGVLLFSSLLEACGIDTAIIIIPGSAIVAWRTEYGSEQWQYLETTMISTNTFFAAHEIGNRRAEFMENSPAKAGDPLRFRRWPVNELRTLYGIMPLE